MVTEGNIHIEERTRFPLIQFVPGKSMGIWPVTKFQFEQFLIESESGNDDYYEKILKLNPRVSYRPRSFKFFVKSIEGLIISGILYEEAVKYCEWLGPEYGVPTNSEWSLFEKFVANMIFPIEPPQGISDSAKEIWNNFAKMHCKEIDPQEVSCSALYGPIFSRIKYGVYEWIADSERNKGRGMPNQSFFKHAYTVNEPIILIKPEQRHHFMGFRVIKRDEWT